MQASLVSTARNIEKALEGMVKRANLIPGYLSRVVYPTYQKAQRERWKSKNAGEDFLGAPWAALDPKYAAWKRKKYSGSPGGGTKLLIRTGDLQASVVGPGEGHRKLIEAKSIRIATGNPYAYYVDERRTFTQWSPKFYGRIYKGIRDYLAKNIVSPNG